MPSILPPQGRPELAPSDMARRIGGLGIDLVQHPLVVVGIRGHFAAAGASPLNERNIYDDALFLYSPSLGICRGFNGNTDPSGYRPGVGARAAKGLAVLNPGVWYAYRFDIHGSRKAPHEAICQRAAEVVVTRDGSPPYIDRGWFGINIHRGGFYTTSSEGCQTIPPEQWGEFIQTAQEAAQRMFGSAWRQRTIPYALLDAALEAEQSQHSAPVAGSRAQWTATQFQAQLVRPVLRQIGFWSEAAENLLTGVALAESGLAERTQRNSGPALGLFQMEPRTHDDHWDYLRRRRSALGQTIRTLIPGSREPSASELRDNDPYACAMARVHFLRVADPLPAADDLEGMAHYWKAHYNTALGAGTPEHFIAAWRTGFGI